MKKLSILLLIFFNLAAQAQFVNNHVKWIFSSKQISDDEYDLILNAKIDTGFHLYSQFIADGGPIPTSFTFEKSSDYKLEGKVKETGKRYEAIEPLFENMKLIWFTDKATFTQRIKLLKPEVVVKGSMTFMTCDDKMCDPPTDVLLEWKVKGTVKKTDSDSTKSSVTAVDTSTKAENNIGIIDSSNVTSNSQISSNQDFSVNKDDVRNQSYWSTFVQGFLTGLLALFFPCVWPVIPLTVSFFLKKNSNKHVGRINALIYTLSIISIFVVLGVLVSLLTNGQKLNELSTGWFFNLLFFVLFFLFGLSFLGVFEITLPASWINKSETLSDKGGLVGIFFMAFTLVLVSFSCTLPFIANLISIVTDEGEFIKPLIGFAAFGLALGLPFGLFAWFPTGLKKLPKSGHWMHVLKVTFGLLEIALSMIYLSKVDMAYHWGLLSRDIFLALWIVIFAVLGLYLLGKIRITAEDDDKHISVPRLLFALFSLAFAFYMMPGLWGSPLKPLSGFLPNYSEFSLLNTEQGGKELNTTTIKKYQNLFEAPLGLDLYFDFDEALAKAKKENKPLFVDFTGWGCVNCRKMEKSVWPNPQVLKLLKEDYITASLYIDDKTTLPQNEHYFSKALNKEVKTLGDRNFDIQYANYKIGAQPYYVLLDVNGNLLTQPRGYTSDIQTYVSFLKEGLTEFNKRQIAVVSH
ncbi:MAG: thioredoxin family protein [Chitinophagales bacterium]|nr:thioredoxin family protein [Chitinophagales bacterium]